MARALPLTDAQFRDGGEARTTRCSASDGLKAAWKALAERIFYHSADATKPESFAGAASEFLAKIDAQVGAPGTTSSTSRVSPTFFAPHRPEPGQGGLARRRTGAGGGW